MRRSIFPKPYADLVARLRVPMGFLLAAAFAWLATPTWMSLAAGLPVAVLGLLVRAWAAGHLAKNERLAVTGPYALARNPLYIGTLLVAAGLAVAARRPALAGLFAVVFLLVYLPAIELEEQHLRELFPGYEEWAARVPMLWPRGRPAGALAGFNWRLYIRNREFNALLGFGAGTAWLVWRALNAAPSP